MTTTASHTVNGITINAGDTVRGPRCGLFVVEKFKMIGDDFMAVLRATNGKGEVARGTLALPVNTITPA